MEFTKISPAIASVLMANFKNVFACLHRAYLKEAIFGKEQSKVLELKKGPSG